jgi:AraC family transcriptional regulator, arabinose operon regulatory protein
MRTETRHPRFGQIVTGHYRQGKGYYAWRSQGTRDWLFIYTVSGQGRFGYHGGEWISQPGEAALLRPGALHDYGVTAPLFRWELLWAHFHPRSEWHEWLAWPEIAPGLGAVCIQQPELRARIEARLKDMHALATGPERRAELFAMNAFEEVLLCCDARNPRMESAPLDSRIRESMDRINRNLAAAITLARLAETARLSVSRYSHLFREQVGTSPQQYIEQQRLNRAQQLLELTPMSVKEIAYEVGFANPFYFTLRFTKRFGKSPRAYRQRRKA